VYLPINAQNLQCGMQHTAGLNGISVLSRCWAVFARERDAGEHHDHVVYGAPNFRRQIEESEVASAAYIVPEYDVSPLSNADSYD
jgi:hypothetical protein